MKRQLKEKGSAPAVQLKRPDNSREDADRTKLLINSARKIGSVLGGIVAKTERSLSVRKPKIELTPEKKGSGGSRKASMGRETTINTRSEKSLLMPGLRKHFKTATDSVRRAPKRKPRAQS